MDLIYIKAKLCAELNNYVVKDTYTKGKLAGIRTAINIIDDCIKASEHDDGEPLSGPFG